MGGVYGMEKVIGNSTSLVVCGPNASPEPPPGSTLVEGTLPVPLP